jgi:hypothetical protein
VFEFSRQLTVTIPALAEWLAPCRFKTEHLRFRPKLPETQVFLKISAPKAALLQNAKAGKVLGDRRWIAEP